MMPILYIAKHEIRRLCMGSMAWVVLAVVQFLLAVLFLFMLSQFVDSAAAALFSNHGVTEIVVVSFLQFAGILFLLIIPLITMSSFSEERQTGSIVLLLSAPVFISECVLGKYLGIMCYVSVLLVVVMLMPLSLLVATDIDLLQLLSASIGLFLLISAFVTIGLFVSSLCSQQAVAAIASYGILFWLWMLDIVSYTDSERLADILTYLSLLSHYRYLLDGIFNSVDVIYYLLVSTLFITLTIWHLDNQRM